MKIFFLNVVSRIIKFENYTIFFEQQKFSLLVNIKQL